MGTAMTVVAAVGTTACEPGVYVVPTQVPADCSVDVTDVLNQWMQAVPDGSTLQFNGGCFRLDQTLVLTDRNDLDIDGQGATFVTDDPTGDGSPLSNPSAEARTRAHWRFTRGNDLKLHDLAIQGANQNAGVDDDAYVEALEAQHGIDIAGTQNIEVYSIVITKVYGDFIYFGPSGSTPSSGHVHDSLLSSNGRQGISVTGGRDVTIDHNFVGYTRRATFDLEPNSPDPGVDGVSITNNTIGPGRLMFVAAAGDGPVNDVVVNDNQLQGRTLTMVIDSAGSARRKNWVIERNTSDTSHGAPASSAAMAYHDIDALQVIGNVQAFDDGRGDSAVDTTGSTEGLVVLNSFVGAASIELGSTDPGVTVCSNQRLADGAYDQPVSC
jgi:hypothetical protein